MKVKQVKITSYTLNFQNFTCIITILVKFDIYFLGLPREIFFRVTTDDLVPLQTHIGIANFGYSKHWNSVVWAFLNIGIVMFGVSKHWNSEFWLSKTLEFCTFPLPNIGIVKFGFSKHWNSEFWQFQTLEFRTFPFPNIGIANFGHSKHWNSLVWAFLNIGILYFWHFQTLEL